jgi:hypothetical protein
MVAERRRGPAGTIAMMSLAMLVAGAGCPGCPPPKGQEGGTTTGGTTTTGTTPLPSSPLQFTASDGSPADCIFTYDTGAPASPTFTVKYGGKGITVSATYSGTSNYDPPPQSMQITYGDSSGVDFDSGLLTLFPAGSGITVNENRPSDWSMTAVGSPSSSKLTWGKTWTVTLSCGATPNCCANTRSVTVNADGTF